MRWPSRAVTTELISRAAVSWDRVESEEAWQQGTRLTLDDLGIAATTPTPEDAVTLRRR